MTLRPGSFAAYRAGCTCDMLVNQFGLGADTTGRDDHHVINFECPLHKNGYIETVSQMFARHALTRKRRFASIEDIKTEWEEYLRKHPNETNSERSTPN